MKQQLNEIKRMQQLAGILKENEQSDPKKYKVGDILNFKDGKQWIVTKLTYDGVLAKPYNKLAQDKYVSIAIDMPFDELEAEEVSVVKDK
jgi:uncharacterized protein YkvS